MSQKLTGEAKLTDIKVKLAEKSIVVQRDIRLKANLNDCTVFMKIESHFYFIAVRSSKGVFSVFLYSTLGS